MNTVPKKVLEAEERAMKLHEEAYKPNEETAAAALEVPPEIEDDDAPINPPDAGDDGHADEPDVSAEYKRLQEAHKALQGKYNAEVPRMASQIRELEEKLKEATRKGERAEKEADEAKKQLADRIDSIRSDFGDDLADVIGDIADRRTDMQAQEESALQNDVNRFWRQVRRAVPDFDAVNGSQDFVQWLQKPDEVTGVARQATLNDAGQDLDAITVVEIVNAFKRERSANQPPSLNTQVAPKRKPRQEQPPEKPTYTVDDFVQLQRDIQAGHYRGREAEAAALEREIHSALMGA